MQYITAQELAAVLKVPGNKVKVVDVRDDDHVGGNIKNSIHFASEKVKDDNLKSLVEKDLKQSDSVVVHCALSKERGPRIGGLIRDELVKQNGEQDGKKVLILTDGFVNFQSLYRNDPDLVEKFDKKVWGGYSA